MSRRVVLAGVVLAVLAAGGVGAMVMRAGSGDCADGGRALDGVQYEDAWAEVTSQDGDTERLCVLVADTSSGRQHGLMGVRDLAPYDGMVFVYDQDTQSPFWMLKTVMPLSIAWFGANGSFVSASDMEPCDRTDLQCPLYAPAGRYRYALEVPKGGLGEWGVEAGARLKLTDDG